MLGNTLKWTTHLNILCQSDQDWVKVFRFYYQSEQEMDKLMSESSEKSRYSGTSIIRTSIIRTISIIWTLFSGPNFFMNIN